MALGRRILFVSAALVLLTGCRLARVAQYHLNTRVTEYPIQTEPARSWDVSENQLSLDTEALGQLGFSSTLVLADDEIVFEWYAEGHNRRSIFNIKSISKSLLSAVTGIAVYEDKLHLDEAIHRVGSCHIPHSPQALTPKHLLNMSAGFQFVENQTLHVYAEKSWSCAILSLPIEANHGERFNYGTVQSYLLGAILEEKTETPLKQYFDERLFEPIEISLKGWRMGPESLPFAGSEMRLTARDLLAFGQLYLDNGKYGERQVVPEPWIEKSFNVAWPSAIENYGYGWHWWKTKISNLDFLTAIGFGGQTLLINRDKQIVVVTTAPIDHHDERLEYVRNLVENIVKDLDDI